jgi:prepilin-type N-terminal cleavage/methylation domain-containing protein
MTGQRGVTMVELAIVITILGIVAWVAYPKLTALDEIKLDAAARRVAADLRYAQSKAIGRRMVHGILFEPAAARYTVFAPSVSTPLADPVNRAKILRVDFSSSPEFKGVSISSAAFGSTPGVTFDYFGVPRDTAGTDLGSVGRVVLSYQGASDTVEVIPTTGKVTVR